jgi:hypothetical protein
MSEVAVCGVFVGPEGEVLVAAVSPLRTFGCFANRPLSVVHGTMHVAGGVRLTELSLEHTAPVREYAFHLRRRGEGQVFLEGAASDSARPLALLLSDEGVASCARFVGSADPDVSLEPFCLPCNPIAWVLARLADGRVCGAGFFDDAADVPGQATLLFRLEGRWEENGTIRFAKRYEKAAGEYTVEYEGRWSEHSITGSWRNALAGSFGSFCARVSSPESEVVALCEGCDACIAPGAPRWKEEAKDSRKEGNGAVWCGNCASGKASLVPDTFAPSRQVHGSSCRQLLLNALTYFAENVFFGSFDSASGAPEEHTYGEALRLAARVVFPKTIGQNSVVVICGPLNWNCVVLTVACVLRRIPLVSLERRELVAPCCIGLSVAAVFDCAEQLTLSDSATVDFDFDRLIQGGEVPAPEAPVAYLPTSGTSGAVPRLALFSDALCLPSEGLVRFFVFFFFFSSFFLGFDDAVCAGGCERVRSQLFAVSFVHGSIWRLALPVSSREFDR